MARLHKTMVLAASYNHCLPFECTYHALMIWHMAYGSLNYELKSDIKTKKRLL